MAEQNFAPPQADPNAPLLRGADGYVVLNIDAFNQRGDLVAGYDPNRKDAYADDEKRIQQIRELELAREEADAAKVAEIEAKKAAADAKAKAEEANKLAEANAQTISKLEQDKLDLEAKLKKQLAEANAKLDAMAKLNGDKGPPKRKNGVKNQAETPDDKPVNVDELDD